MPSNIFATTGTNVSILLIDKANTDKVVLVDASKLGQKVKDGKNQKTLLSAADEQQIIDAFATKQATDDFSVVVDYEAIKEKNYSLSAGQYFDIKIEYVALTSAEFEAKMSEYKENLKNLFAESAVLEKAILDNLSQLNFN
jgi:type I restriction enzyme M protein